MAASQDITVDSAEARRAIELLFARTLNLREPFEEIGASLLTSTQQRFEDEQAPDGTPWADLALSTQLRRVTKRQSRGGSHILRVKGLLAASVTYLATPVELTMGSNRVQAALMQLGGTSEMAPGPAAVPARPFLGLSSADEREATDILLDHLGTGLS
jgi:phage virion morphogenesis protein